MMSANTNPLPPIPTPPEQRWREFRIQILPIIVFAGVLAAIAIMWKTYFQPHGVIGEVEAVKARVPGAERAIGDLRLEQAQDAKNGPALVSVEP